VLGQGVYEIAEISQYVGLPPTTVTSWFKPRSDRAGRGPIFQSDYAPVGKDYAVSFLNLMEVYVARFFRNQGVGPSLIRRAHQILKGELGVDHPFAHANLRTDGKRIILDKASPTSDRQLVDVVNKQRWFNEIRNWLSHVDYEAATQMARQWNIAEGVIINPAIRFGKPVVSGFGITTYVLWRQYLANRKNEALVADLFDITEKAVTDAASFESSIHNGGVAHGIFH